MENLSTLTTDELFAERSIISDHIRHHKNIDELNLLINQLSSIDLIINKKLDELYNEN